MITAADAAPHHPLLPESWSLADLARHIDVPLDRIRLFPSPGFAIESDLVLLCDRKIALCELIDGVLVEKVLDCSKSILEGLLSYAILNHLGDNHSGIVVGAACPIRMVSGNIRMPDAAFITKARWRLSEKGSVLTVAPDLAIHILLAENTPGEMNRKTAEYFSSGTKLVWITDPETRTAKAYRSATEFTDVPADGALDGGEVLPGFTLPLAPLLRRVYDE